MKVCGFDLFGALSKNTGQATADKMNKSGGRGESERQRKKERGREKVLSALNIFLYQELWENRVRKFRTGHLSLSSAKDTLTGITEFRRMTEPQIK